MEQNQRRSSDSAAGQPAPLNVPQPPPAVGDGRHQEPAAIGASISIVGDVSGSEDLTILGRVEGKVALPNHNVTIGRSGRVTADSQAKAVSVEGDVRGNLVAGQQILIRKSATMLGNLTAPRVGLEDGCRFKGSLDMEAGGEKSRRGAPPRGPASGLIAACGPTSLASGRSSAGAAREGAGGVVRGPSLPLCLGSFRYTSPRCPMRSTSTKSTSSWML